MTENEVAKVIVDTAYHIRVRLGPGVLESVYQEVLAYELKKCGLHVVSKEPVPIAWADLKFDKGYEADLIVEDGVIVGMQRCARPIGAHPRFIQHDV